MSDIKIKLRQNYLRFASETEQQAKLRRQAEREEGADRITALEAENAALREAQRKLETENERWELWYMHWKEWSDYPLPDPPAPEGIEK